MTAVSLVSVYFVLLFGIPSKLHVRQIGSAGTPATLWGLFLLLWWVCVTIGGSNPRGWSPVRIGLAVLTGSVCLSYAAAMARGWYVPTGVRQATDEVYDLVPATVQQVRTAMILAADRGLLAFGSWLGVALVVLDGTRSWRDVSRLVNLMITVGGIVAMVGVIQFFTGLDIASFYNIPGLSAQYEFGGVDQRSVVRRILATANHPIEFGVIMAGLLPLAIHRTIYARSSKVAWFSLVTIAFSVAASVSRSAIVVAAVGLALMFVSWPAAWRLRFLLTLPAVVVGVRLAAPGVVGTIRSLFINLGNDPSVSGRTDDYAVVTQIFADNPVLGRGLFTFVPRYYRILDNQVFMIMLELGVIGVGATSMLVIVSFMSARGARRRSTDEERRHLGLALSASLVGVVASYATFDTWGFPMAAGLSFVLVGLCGAAWNVSRLPTDMTDAPAGLAVGQVSADCPTVGKHATSSASATGPRPLQWQSGLP